MYWLLNLLKLVSSDVQKSTYLTKKKETLCLKKNLLPANYPVYPSQKELTYCQKQFNCSRPVMHPTQRDASCGPFIKPFSPTLKLYLKAYP